MKTVFYNIIKMLMPLMMLKSAVTGFSGILLSTKFYMTPNIGWAWMVKGFVVAVFGGLGSYCTFEYDTCYILNSF